MEITNQVRSFIEEHQLFGWDETLILGISGGVDSVVLLDILHQLNCNIILAHCNFHLRDAESLRDELFVANLAKQYDLKLHKIDFDTQTYAKNNSLSIEMAARELRYRWFEQIRAQEEATSIAIAHHKDDSVETVLMNLIRGTGIKGLTGISPKNNNIVRPLLCLERCEIEIYASVNNLQYVVDSTNLENVYKRNYIRLDIIPQLKVINPSVNKSIDNCSKRLQEVFKIYDYYIEQQKRIVCEENKISITKLMDCESPKSVLYEILLEFGFNSSSVDEIYKAIGGESGKLFYSEKYIVLKDRDYLILKMKNSDIKDVEYLITADNIEITEPIHLTLEEINLDSHIDFKIDSNELLVDYNKLSFPLTIRKWKEGDRFVPFGMKGTKKLSDYFSDSKMSIFEKEDTWLLLSGNKIVWIIGKRADNRFRVNKDTEKLLRVKYNSRGDR